ncbi:MAG TPA: hypothetical protein VHW46_07175 [Terracidiphilus sp.]|jgi:hypothetical protein|nr:hypothetical protein [Terracidiphilus sp.]
MGIANEQLKTRTGRLRVVANLALVAGLLLWVFARPSARPLSLWVDGTVGLLMGMSLAMNVALLVRARRCRQNAAQS